jgi:hypothetical protein
MSTALVIQLADVASPQAGPFASLDTFLISAIVLVAVIAACILAFRSIALRRDRRPGEVQAPPTAEAPDPPGDLGRSEPQEEP